MANVSTVTRRALSRRVFLPLTMCFRNIVTLARQVLLQRGILETLI